MDSFGAIGKYIGDAVDIRKEDGERMKQDLELKIQKVNEDEKKEWSSEQKRIYKLERKVQKLKKTIEFFARHFEKKLDLPQDPVVRKKKFWSSIFGASLNVVFAVSFVVGFLVLVFVKYWEFFEQVNNVAFFFFFFIFFFFFS